MKYGHIRSMPSSISRATAAAALALMMVTMGATAARAASLGKLEITSGVGEPLRGRIEVVGATRHELDTLGARLASRDRYGDAGLTYAPALERLHFTLAKHRGGRHYVDVTSIERYSEPVLDLVVELAWFGGARSYAYTALVDPVGSETSPSVSAPSPVGQASDVAVGSRKTGTPLPQITKGAKATKAIASAKPSVAADEALLADKIRVEEGKAEQAKHKLAAAQERIADLERTVQEQEHLLNAVAADAIVGDMHRSEAAPHITRASHETAAAKPATPVQATSDAWDSTYVAGAGVAAVLVVLILMRRGRRTGAEKEQYLHVAPSLQPAT